MLRASTTAFWALMPSLGVLTTFPLACYGNLAISSEAMQPYAPAGAVLKWLIVTVITSIPVLAPLVLIWVIWPYIATYKIEVPLPVCRKCGYDLRATPERCPECGTSARAADGR